jgi:hypothetical protein
LLPVFLAGPEHDSVPVRLQKDIGSLMERLEKLDVCSSAGTSRIESDLGTTRTSTDVSHETICAWLAAAEQGDLAAVHNLRDFQLRYSSNVFQVCSNFISFGS